MSFLTAGQATSRELKRAMSERGWTADEAGTQLGVTRRHIQRWLAGEPMPTKKLQVLAEQAETKITISIGEQQEAAPPEWATRLAVGMAKAVISALSPGVSKAERAAALAYLALLEDTPSPNGDSPHGSEEAISPDESKPRERGRG